MDSMKKDVTTLYRELIKTNEQHIELANICKESFKQIDKRFFVGFIACVVCLSIIEDRRKNMQVEIDKLKSQVKELAATKGE